MPKYLTKRGTRNLNPFGISHVPAAVPKKPKEIGKNLEKHLLEIIEKNLFPTNQELADHFNVRKELISNRLGKLRQRMQVIIDYKTKDHPDFEKALLILNFLKKRASLHK